jgi:hypothetical protein
LPGLKLPSADDRGAWLARHLIYLDEARTHELHAEVNAGGQGLALVTTEFPAGSGDPLEALQLEQVRQTPAEVLTRLKELETRLASSGAYWRADAQDMRWTKVDPGLLPRLDMRAHEFDMPDGSGRIKFHHFHGKGADRLFVSMPRGDLQGRHILADLAFEFPRVDAAEVEILHTRLAPSLLQSRLVQEHIELPRKGFQKLVEPVQYERAFGSGWRDAARSTFQKATSLLLGRPSGPLAHEAPRGEASLSQEIQATLTSETVKECLRRFLSAQDEAQLVTGGEFAVRRWVNLRRRRADHRDQWRLTIAEAAMLVRWALETGRQQMVNDEGAKLVRMSKVPVR